MKIILSKQCESLTGSLGRGFGYHIEHRKNGFFSKRDQRGNPPCDGHWRFIVTCAQLAQNKLHIADIEVTGFELKIALQEACLFESSLCVDLDNVYSAKDVIQFKTERGL